MIRVPLSKKMLFDKLTNCTVTADMIDNVVDFRVEYIVQAGVDANGFIVA